MQLTKEERIFLVITFNDIKNVTEVVQLFQNNFQGTSVRKLTVRKTVVKFSTHGTILNRNKGNSGGRFTRRIQENIQMMHSQIEENENFSSRRHEQIFLGQWFIELFKNI
ncbi:Protein of unknown function DUF4817 [Trinorchestia longiramus]|nr:Protein of unknown function DUF4817 [Trinorchestia longiramus]